MHGWWHGLSYDDLVGFAHAGFDVIVVGYLIYRVMMLAKGTRAWQIFMGLMVFVGILRLSDVLNLLALKWILLQMFALGPVAIVILFFPELRHALEEVGRLGFWGRNLAVMEREDVSLMVGELVRAAGNLSDKKIGALIVLERETGLTDIVETGTTVNAVVTAELLGTVFYPGSPLHDGAVVIRRDRVVSAGCTLPLSESREIGTTVHTRHKAALGMSEQSDALVLVISEESGIISLAFGGKMVRGLRDDALRDRLMHSYLGRERSPAKRRRTSFRAAAQATVSPLTSFAPFLAIRQERGGKSSNTTTLPATGAPPLAASGRVGAANGEPPATHGRLADGGGSATQLSPAHAVNGGQPGSVRVNVGPAGDTISGQMTGHPATSPANAPDDGGAGDGASA